MTSYEKLESRFRQFSRLSDLRAVASWDEAVMMPVGSGQARGEALGELTLIMQKLLATPEVGGWIEEASATQKNLSDWQLANLNEIKRMYVESTAIPPELNQRLSMACTNCEQLWRKARGQNDWLGFMPSLQKVLTLKREALQELGKHLGLSTYDAALSMNAKGLNRTIVKELFDALKGFLPGMTKEVLAKQAKEQVLIPEGTFPKEAQRALGLELMKLVGFNMEIGRLDESHHPFCGGSPRDVRITTRYNEKDFVSSLMSVLHETGHALYEQNLPREWVEQPVGAACGMAIHESQSLLMEMQVVRSREFLQFVAPVIRKHLGAFVSNPGSLAPENLFKLVNRVEPGFIRVDADEVTYPAHVILRFEIETDLLEDRWPLSELPHVWNEKMTEYLGLNTTGDFKNGCMQDVHWPAGLWGYFPAYTFGAVIAAQLFERVKQVRPTVLSEVGRGDFTGLQSWLRENIWSQGSRMDTLQLVEHAAGPLSTKAFRSYLNGKYC